MLQNLYCRSSLLLTLAVNDHGIAGFGLSFSRRSPAHRLCPIDYLKQDIVDTLLLPSDFLAVLLEFQLSVGSLTQKVFLELFFAYGSI